MSRVKIPWSPERLSRFWPALATICLPYGFLFLIYAPSVTQLLRIRDWTVLQKIEFSPIVLDRFAQNVQGLFLLGIGSGFLRGTAVLGIILAAIVLGRAIGFKAGLSVIAVILLACSVAFVAAYLKCRGLQPDEKSALSGYIARVLHVILAAAKQRGVVLETTIAEVDVAILLNLFALMTGFNSLLAAFASLAVRASPSELTPQCLTDRVRALGWVTIAAAVLLVFVTAVNKALIVWPQGLLTPSGQKTYAYIAGAIANYWGAYGSIALICALIPALISLMADIDVAARAAGGGSVKAESDWKRDNGFSFDFKSGMAAALTTAAPILTGPGMDLLGSLLR
jgi:hypothetical protein